jgi:hypothetical protein
VCVCLCMCVCVCEREREREREREKGSEREHFIEPSLNLLWSAATNHWKINVWLRFHIVNVSSMLPGMETSRNKLKIVGGHQDALMTFAFKFETHSNEERQCLRLKSARCTLQKKKLRKLFGKLFFLFILVKAVFTLDKCCHIKC